MIFSGGKTRPEEMSTHFEVRVCL